MDPMDVDNTSTPSRKVRFAPKGPPPRRRMTISPKSEEPSDEADDEAAQALRRRVKDQLGRRGPKVKKTSSVHVAFGREDESLTSMRTYGKPSEGNVGKSDGLVSEDSTRNNEQITVSSPSITSADGNEGSSTVGVDNSYQKINRDYKEPWDYHHSYYPTTLPLRRPYSGDPELLDEIEFGKDAANLEYDEDVTNSAAGLGLLDKNEKAQMLFLQLPPNLPLVRRGASADGQVALDNSKPSRGTVASAEAKGKAKVGREDPGVSPGVRETGIAGNSMFSFRRSAPMKGCSLEELPAGYMGKMLVYKSGAIKLKLGDTLYDVSPGSSCIFAQDIVAINTIDKECCKIGEIEKRAVISPDVDSLLADVIDLS